MTLSPTQLLSFGLIIGILVFITLFFLRPVDVAEKNADDNNIAEWFAVNTVNISTTEHGIKKNKVSAKHLTHYAELKETFIVEPLAEIYNPDEPAWHLRANTGLAIHGSGLEDMREIDLNGNVMIWQEASKDRPASEITTEFLKFYPLKDYAETDQLVNFKHGSHQMSGVGMQAYLAKEQVKLLHQVRGQYVRE